MPTVVDISLSPAALALLDALGPLPREVMTALVAAVDQQNEILVGQIQRERLSQRGPFSLGVVTNRLRLSVRPTRARLAGDTIESSIGSNVRYAAVHEFGFDGNVTVRAHQRRRFAVGQVRAVLTPAGKIRKVKPKRVVAATVTVRQHERHMRVFARAPIGRGIRDHQAEYTAALSQAVITALNGGRP